jgi:thymidylate synthase
MSSYNGEEGYINLLCDTLKKGEYKKGRNGNTYSVFGQMISFYNIYKSFPLLTTKKMFTKGIIEEILWFLRGSTDAKELQKQGVKIWDGNSSREYLDSIGLSHYSEGELGPVYGWQWRNFGKRYNKEDDNGGFDQLKYIIQELMKPENSRRAVLSGWNPTQLSEMALPPCHILYTFYKNKNGISCMMNMRSSDLFLGLPFNIASTSILTHIIAKVLHVNPVDISITITDAHIYEEHIDAVNEQVKNKILDSAPTLTIRKEPPPIDSPVDEKIKWINCLKYEDFVVNNYKSAGTIKAPMK